MICRWVLAHEAYLLRWHVGGGTLKVGILAICRIGRRLVILLTTVDLLVNVLRLALAKAAHRGALLEDAGLLARPRVCLLAGRTRAATIGSGLVQRCRERH